MPFRTVSSISSPASPRPLARTCDSHTSHAISPIRSLHSRQVADREQPEGPRQASSTGRKDRQREIEAPACFVDCGEGVGRRPLRHRQQRAGSASTVRWGTASTCSVPRVLVPQRGLENPRTCSQSSAAGHFLLEMRRNLFDVLGSNSPGRSSNCCWWSRGFVKTLSKEPEVCRLDPAAAVDGIAPKSSHLVGEAFRGVA